MAAQGPTRASASTRSDWQTPPDLWNLKHDEFRFNLDGAASEENAMGDLPYFGPGDIYLGGRCLGVDAFEQHGKPDDVIWVNPPYGRALVDWIRLFKRWNEEGATVVAIVPDATDTEWFTEIWHSATEIRFLQGRVPFINPLTGKPAKDNTGGSQLDIWRPVRPNPVPTVSLWDWRADIARHAELAQQAKRG